jgi:hypothetical protein
MDFGEKVLRAIQQQLATPSPRSARWARGRAHNREQQQRQQGERCLSLKLRRLPEKF